jgi:serine/threonine protein kinase
LKFLHGKNICHRDIKPQNILLTKKSQFVSGKAVLADFDLSKMDIPSDEIPQGPVLLHSSTYYNNKNNQNNTSSTNVN